MTLRPVEADFLPASTVCRVRGNDHDGIVEFHGLAALLQEPIDLRIHVAGGAGA